VIVHWLTAVVACLLPLAAGEIDARRTRARTNQGKTK